MKLLVILQRLFQVKQVSKKGTTRVEDATVGILNVLQPKTPSGFTSIYNAITIENGGASSFLVNKDRRIMPGVYNLHKSKTTVPLPNPFKATGEGIILDSDQDKGFINRRIFIHAGNYPQDTEGCILLQSHYDFTSNPGYGGGSMRACEKFYSLVFDYQKMLGDKAPSKGLPAILLIRDEDAITKPLDIPSLTL